MGARAEIRSRGKRRLRATEGEEAAAGGSAPAKFRFQCEECDAEFKVRCPSSGQKWGLERELGAGFESRENIVEHLRKVHRQRMMHQCPKCDKFFSVKAKLARHEQIHLV